jgi:hypothetical protein
MVVVVTMSDGVEVCREPTTSTLSCFLFLTFSVERSGQADTALLPPREGVDLLSGHDLASKTKPRQMSTHRL